MRRHSLSDPETSLKSRLATGSVMPKALEVCFWHSVQWQMIAGNGSPVSS